MRACVSSTCVAVCMHGRVCVSVCARVSPCTCVSVCLRVFLVKCKHSTKPFWRKISSSIFQNFLRCSVKTQEKGLTTCKPAYATFVKDHFLGVSNVLKWSDEGEIASCRG